MLHPEWSYQAVIYEMNVRQLTREGTLRAAAAKLGFLRDMGIDAVWLMPVYPIGAEGRKGSLGSYYSIRDYCAVDPGLGTMGDFDAFVAEAHRLGMKVLLDWVPTIRRATPAGSARSLPTGMSAMPRGRPPCPGTGRTPPNSTMRTATYGGPRPTPWSSGCAGTPSMVSAATWRCSCPWSSGMRLPAACGR